MSWHKMVAIEAQDIACTECHLPFKRGQIIVNESGNKVVCNPCADKLVNNNKEDSMESPGNPDPPAEPEAPAEGGDQVGGDKVEGDKVEPGGDGQADPSGGDN